MEFLYSFFKFFLVLFFDHLIYISVGFLLYKFGFLISNSFIVKVGHGIFALGCAPYFGLFSGWIEKHCPHHNCSSCRLWTCKAYCKAKK